MTGRMLTNLGPDVLSFVGTTKRGDTQKPTQEYLVKEVHQYCCLHFPEGGMESYVNIEQLVLRTR